MNELPPSLQTDGPGPWGCWATLGFGIVVLVVSAIVQLGIGVVFMIAAVVQNPEIDVESYAAGLSSNGSYFAIAVVISGVLSVPITALFAVLRKGFPVRDYLALRLPTLRQLVIWLLLTGALIAAGDTFTYLINRPVVPDSVLQTLKTSYFAPFLFLALLVVAPVFEEVLFRGFLFQGIRYSRLGPIGAIVLTSLGWSSLHLQYDVYYIGYIFVSGLLLGLARLKTGSTYLTIGMHSFSNLIATVEALVVIYVLGG